MLETNYNGHKLAYRKEGDAENILVLLHGFPENSTVFHQQISYLKDYFTVIVPDLPGAGKSEYNDNLTTVEDFAEAIHAIFNQESIAKAVILGHSMGAYIALAFVEKYPDLVSGFGFIHSTAWADSDEKKEMRLKSIELMQKYGAHNFVQKAISPLFAESNRSIFATEIAVLTKEAEKFQTESLVRFYEIMLRRPDRTAVLKTNKPVFFFLGKEDKASPLADLLEQVSIPAIADITILENVAHMGMIEAAGILNQKIVAFQQLIQNTN